MLFKSFAVTLWLQGYWLSYFKQGKKAVVTVKLQNVFGLTETIKETSCSKITF